MRSGAPDEPLQIVEGWVGCLSLRCGASAPQAGCHAGELADDEQHVAGLAGQGMTELGDAGGDLSRRHPDGRGDGFVDGPAESPRRTVDPLSALFGCRRSLSAAGPRGW